MDASAYICARAPYFLNSIILHIVWFSPESSILSLWAMAFLTRVILYFSALATWDGTVPADLVLNPPFFLRPISLSSYWKYGTGLYVYLPVWFCTIISWRINYTTIVFFFPPFWGFLPISEQIYCSFVFCNKACSLRIFLQNLRTSWTHIPDELILVDYAVFTTFGNNSRIPVSTIRIAWLAVALAVLETCLSL